MQLRVLEFLVYILNAIFRQKLEGHPPRADVCEFLFVLFLLVKFTGAQKNKSCELSRACTRSIALKSFQHYCRCHNYYPCYCYYTKIVSQKLIAHIVVGVYSMLLRYMWVNSILKYGLHQISRVCWQVRDENSNNWLGMQIFVKILKQEAEYYVGIDSFLTLSAVFFFFILCRTRRWPWPLEVIRYKYY